ncbi:amidase family protein [Rhizobium sp. CNPSo 4039]|uniref:amidase family protein n=1 Tax=Rhizobium sp. CNPSo 4039 TaxID=3021409 RepID=UPI002549D68D|nr:amidase family protein [Rhizobium sp. CNPSo 4039]MDK4716005.1 amidase family protein [Rhizobium sp. CNPSo 4039]
MTDAASSSLPSSSRLKAILAKVDGSPSDYRDVFTRLYAASAADEAEASDKRRAAGRAPGPLDGRIVSIKDLFDVEGEVTLAGGLPGEGDKPAVEDADVVSVLRKCGTVIVGKTNMTEYAFSGLGLNPHYGTPANSGDPRRIPGGSSSGAAISVALDLADLAIGSDTGGSVRIPAALNGLVGFKPSQNRISRRGVFPLSFTLDCVGFIAKDLPIIAAAYDVLATDDRSSIAPAETIRCGVPRGFLFSGMEVHVGHAFAKALHGLQQQGHVVIDVDLDGILAKPFELQSKGTLVGAEAAYIHAERMGDPSRFDPFVLSRLRKGQALDAATYVGILQQRAALMPRLDAAMTELDILIMPTVPVVAPLFSELEGEGAMDRANALLLRNPSVFNFFDLPAISLPIETGDGACAVGCMIVGRRGEDRRLISIAEAFRSEVKYLAR